jgi:hypothetical protein
MPRLHFVATADRHSETRRRLRPWPSVPWPIRKTRPPNGGVDSGVAENTPGNKLSYSVLNLFPSGTDISVLGNCLSSSTATPPSEHTPLRRRCCSEPFFDFHRHSTEADRRRPIASFLKEAPLSPSGASAFSACRGHTDVWCLLQWVTASYILMKFPKRDIDARQEALQRKSYQRS